MPNFHYTAYDSTGRQISGQIEAASREAALRSLSQQGSYPIDAVERAGRSSGPAAASSSSSSGGWFERRPSAAEVTLFTQELGLLLSSGQPLTGALSLLEDDTSTPRVQAMAQRLRASIAGGRSLHEAMALEASSFPPVYVGMVKAAEASGTLETVLARIAETREREQRMRSKFTSALLYPALLIVMAIGAVALMIMVVVPQFKEMLGDQAARLPASSLAILAASDWLTAHAQHIAIGIGVAVLGLIVLWRQPAAQAAIERTLYAMPLIGSLLRLSLTASFCRTLGVLLASGLGLPAALALTRDVIGNAGAKEIIDRIGVALREGKDFTEPLRQSKVFPPMVTSLLRIGAESGTLAPSALRLADMYDTKLEIAMQRLVTVLEPAIILFVSVFIGFIVLSIMGAIVGVYDLAGP